MGIWDAVGAVISKVVTFIPGRIEGLKNERLRLINERSNILNGPATGRAIDRISVIDHRVSEINAIFGNKATD
jgi:hypothetical protein